MTLDELHRLNPGEAEGRFKGSRVYFIRASENGPIKVGVTSSSDSLIRRIEDLQVGNAQRLHLLGEIEGDTAREKQIHRLFSGFRLMGEWFSSEPMVLETIEIMLDGRFDWETIDKKAASHRPRIFRPSTIHLTPVLGVKIALAAREVGVTPSELVADILADVFPDDDTMPRETLDGPA